MYQINRQILRGVGIYIIGEFLCSLGFVGVPFVLWSLANVFWLQALLSSPVEAGVDIGESLAPSSPTIPKSPTLQGKEILAEILAVTNRVQPEQQLIDSIIAIVYKYVPKLNLIHMSTILKKLSQAKLLAGRFVLEPVWAEVFYPRTVILLEEEAEESKMLRTAVSVIICLARAAVLPATPSDKLLAAHVDELETSSMVQLLAVLPKHMSSFEKIKNRFEREKFDLSHIDVSTLLCNLTARMDVGAIVKRCSAYNCSGLSLLVFQISNRVNDVVFREEIISHVRTYLSFDDVKKASCSPADISAIVRVLNGHQPLPESVIKRLKNEFFEIACSSRILFKALQGSGDFRSLALALESYLNQPSVDWEKVACALQLIGDTEFPYKVLKQKFDCLKGEVSDAAKLVIKSGLAERVEGFENSEKFEFTRVHNHVLESLLILSLYESSKSQRSKASAVVTQSVGKVIPGSVYLASQAMLSEVKALDLIVKFVEPQLGYVSFGMLYKLIPVMNKSEALVNELTSRVKGGKLNLDQLILTLDTYSTCNGKHRMLDPLFVALQQWLVPEIPRLNLEAIGRLSKCLEKFGGDTDSLSESSITTP